LASGSADGTILLWDLPTATGRAKLPAAPPTRDELEQLWADLAGADAPRAAGAIRRLTAVPEQAIAFMKERLRPAVLESSARIHRLVAELDAEEFAVREAASQELRKLGAAAELAVRAAVEGTTSLEVRLRGVALLAELKPEPPADADLRWLRAVQALERMEGEAAHELLKSLAGGDGLAPRTEDARAALRRWEERHGTRRQLKD
jgi:hypothetical protein